MQNEQREVGKYLFEYWNKLLSTKNNLNIGKTRSAFAPKGLRQDDGVFTSPIFFWMQVEGPAVVFETRASFFFFFFREGHHLGER